VRAWSLSPWICKYLYETLSSSRVSKRWSRNPLCTSRWYHGVSDKQFCRGYPCRDYEYRNMSFAHRSIYCNTWYSPMNSSSRRLYWFGLDDYRTQKTRFWDTDRWKKHLMVFFRSLFMRLFLFCFFVFPSSKDFWKYHRIYPLTKCDENQKKWFIKYQKS